ISDARSSLRIARMNRLSQTDPSVCTEKKALLPCTTVYGRRLSGARHGAWRRSGKQLAVGSSAAIELAVDAEAVCAVKAGRGGVLLGRQEVGADRGGARLPKQLFTPFEETVFDASADDAAAQQERIDRRIVEL